MPLSLNNDFRNGRNIHKPEHFGARWTSSDRINRWTHAIPFLLRGPNSAKHGIYVVQFLSLSPICHTIHNICPGQHWPLLRRLLSELGWLGVGCGGEVGMGVEVVILFSLSSSCILRGWPGSVLFGQGPTDIVRVMMGLRLASSSDRYYRPTLAYHTHLILSALNTPTPSLWCVPPSKVWMKQDLTPTPHPDTPLPISQHTYICINHPRSLPYDLILKIMKKNIPYPSTPSSVIGSHGDLSFSIPEYQCRKCICFHDPRWWPTSRSYHSWKRQTRPPSSSPITYHGLLLFMGESYRVPPAATTMIYFDECSS